MVKSGGIMLSEISQTPTDNSHSTPLRSQLKRLTSVKHRAEQLLPQSRRAVGEKAGEVQKGIGQQGSGTHA